MSLQTKCNSCKRAFPLNYTYCPDCGTKLISPNAKEVLKRLPNAYRSAYGVWHVTTEGDCEGRSTTDLGVHEGYLDEIAHKLSGRAYYGLQFTPQKEIPEEPAYPARGSVDISLDIGSKTWDMNKTQRVEYLSYLLRKRPVEVKDGHYYACVELNWGGEEDE